MIHLETIPGCDPAFLSHVSQKKVRLKECRVGLDKGAPEIKVTLDVAVQRVK